MTKDNPVALVTGAARGIGLATAKLLAEQGVTVARRTVAKYRESMNIVSSSERRQRPAR